MSFSDLGNLKCLSFDEIEPGNPTEAHEYLIASTANLLSTEGRNWLPVIVKEIEFDRYQVVGNSFGYAVAEKAGLEEVWCIIVDDSPETSAAVQALSQESVPKTNLSTADRDSIRSALDYLTKRPNTPLKGVNVALTATRINEAPRQYWSSFQPIANLGCRITDGEKLKALEQVFYLTPQPLPENIQDKSLLQSFGVKQLRELAKKRNIKRFSKMSKAELVESIASD